MLSRATKSAAILSLNESNSLTANIIFYFGLELSNQKNVYLDVNPVKITLDAKIILAKRVERIVGDRNSIFPEEECSFWRPVRLL